MLCYDVPVIRLRDRSLFIVGGAGGEGRGTNICINALRGGQNLHKCSLGGTKFAYSQNTGIYALLSRIAVSNFFRAPRTQYSPPFVNNRPVKVRFTVHLPLIYSLLYFFTDLCFTFDEKHIEIL